MRPYSGIPAMSVKIYVDDALARLRQLPDSSVNCVITSPPYWGLRDYGIAGQLGLEATPEKHIAALIKVFREVKRVLKPDGTLWVNYGDTYASSVNGRPAAEVVNDNRTFRDKPFSTVVGRLKPKDLVGLPWLLAFALRDRLGFICAVTLSGINRTVCRNQPKTARPKRMNIFSVQQIAALLL